VASPGFGTSGAQNEEKTIYFRKYYKDYVINSDKAIIAISLHIHSQPHAVKCQSPHSYELTLKIETAGSLSGWGIRGGKCPITSDVNGQD